MEGIQFDVPSGDGLFSAERGEAPWLSSYDKGKQSWVILRAHLAFSLENRTMMENGIFL
jgi:hypothetical protein